MRARLPTDILLLIVHWAHLYDTNDRMKRLRTARDRYSWPPGALLTEVFHRFEEVLSFYERDMPIHNDHFLLAAAWFECSLYAVFQKQQRAANYMSVSPFWNSRYDAAQQMYRCAWCDNMLKCVTSKSAANPNRNFVGCNKDYGGCGLFSWLDGQPDERFNPSKKKAGVKRGRPGGEAIVGSVTAAPPDALKKLADLATEVADLRAELKAVHERVTMLEEN